MLSVYFAFRGKVVGSGELSFRQKSAVFLLLCLTQLYYQVTHYEIIIIMILYSYNYHIYYFIIIKT